MPTAFDEEHVKAEIAKLKAETELIEAQNRKTRAETEQKLAIEVARIVAETGKLNRETFFYPFIAFTGVVAATFALLKVTGLLK